MARRFVGTLFEKKGSAVSGLPTLMVGIELPSQARRPVRCDFAVKDDFVNRSTFLRQQFLQEGRLPFTEVLSAECFSHVLEKDRSPLERQDLHAAGDAVGVPGTSSQRRPLLPCRGGPVDRPSRLAGSEAVQLGDGGLLPGEKAAAGTILLSRGPPGGAKPRRQRRRTMAVEGPPRISVRWLDGLHARHRGEPQGIPSDLQSESRARRSRSRGLGPSFRSRVERSSSWGSAVTPGKAKASWGCCASCGACFAAATSWWRIA